MHVCILEHWKRYLGFWIYDKLNQQELVTLFSHFFCNTWCRLYLQRPPDKMGLRLLLYNLFTQNLPQGQHHPKVRRRHHSIFYYNSFILYNLSIFILLYLFSLLDILLATKQEFHCLIWSMLSHCAYDKQFKSSHKNLHYNSFIHQFYL